LDSWRYGRAGLKEEYDDFGVLENVLLRGARRYSSLEAMSIEV
jgi:hypothetical protein